MDQCRGVEAKVTGTGGQSQCFFAARPFLAEEEQAEVLGCLALLDRRLPPGCRPLKAAGSSGGPGPGGWTDEAAEALAASSSEMARERWLDLVAGLLEASDAALTAGLVLEAFALEGVSGRLLGVLLGDARLQPAGLGGGASLAG